MKATGIILVKGSLWFPSIMAKPWAVNEPKLIVQADLVVYLRLTHGPFVYQPSALAEAKNCNNW
ncbi:hypothetical protein HPP92_023134 [Vanilla planifolia]|uniref:Uncharacterized protein n=1 Tax=Vanilla planifolia TaxID=51239 RepID=A0A835PX06_VANPL|nr:hypothetical protein HPP92_023134 [Vanilla planifolia]